MVTRFACMGGCHMGDVCVPGTVADFPCKAAADSRTFDGQSIGGWNHFDRHDSFWKILLLCYLSVGNISGRCEFYIGKNPKEEEQLPI
jgi:hypothetical protein